MANPLEQIKAEASRIEEDSLYSAKGHWEAAKPWEHRHLWLGIPTTVCAAVAGVSAFSNHPILSGAFSVIVAVGTALVTFVNPSERHRRHSDAGNSYKALSNQSRIFRTIDCDIETDLSALTAKLKDLAQHRDDLNQGSPLIPRKAFEAARRGIEAGEASHEVDKRR
ncbi:MAG: SLATT domain-containing protein [Lacunisphaera sp.]|nr:SLATT domain-containing protein [Lacunisphaera sp.]